jgi:hypothetical protein
MSLIFSDIGTPVLLAAVISYPPNCSEMIQKHFPTFLEESRDVSHPHLYLALTHIHQICYYPLYTYTPAIATWNHMAILAIFLSTFEILSLI